MTSNIRKIMTAVAAIAALSAAACSKPAATTTASNTTTTTTVTNTVAAGNTTAATGTQTASMGTTDAQGNFKYNTPPEGDAQYASCLKYTMTKYENGEQSSPVAGQSKSQAFCTCMWNETPEDFKGDLAKFSETSKGAETNTICEKHADWHS